LVPRSFRVLAFVLVIVMSGASAWVAELAADDDCAERCADEQQDGCPDEGCGDCVIVCSSCPRNHVVIPSPGLLPVALFAVEALPQEADERMPVGPPPEGVFHPPRLAG
jgi:hypothetical protein